MRLFVDRDGRHFRCRNERDLVAALHRRASTKSATDRRFMQEMARRQMLNGHRYRTDTYKRFVGI
jgi:hypothetical protein